jgi:ribosomal protein S6--L-glutamate ligase
MTSSKRVVGREEWCAFPELGIPAIKARVDSGAKTSSIHAFNLQPFRRNGVTWVSFEIHPIQDNRRIVIRCERPVIDKRSVKSSSGLSETRYVISTPMKMGDEIWDIEATLANRDSMGYRMLLGREAMIDKLIVDPALSCTMGKMSEDVLIQYCGQREAEKSGLKIGVLASNEELYSNQRILEAGEERGHEMVFFECKTVLYEIGCSGSRSSLPRRYVT